MVLSAVGQPRFQNTPFGEDRGALANYDKRHGMVSDDRICKTGKDMYVAGWAYFVDGSGSGRAFFVNEYNGDDGGWTLLSSLGGPNNLLFLAQNTGTEDFYSWAVNGSCPVDRWFYFQATIRNGGLDCTIRIDGSEVTYSTKNGNSGDPFQGFEFNPTQPNTAYGGHIHSGNDFWFIRGHLGPTKISNHGL